MKPPKYTALCLLLFAPTLLFAQVKLSSNAVAFNNIPTTTACTNAWFPLGTVSISESLSDDLPGNPGNGKQTLFSVFVRMAPGFKLNPSGVSWSIASGPNSDLDQQTCVNTTPNVEFAWDDFSGANPLPVSDPTAKNVVILHVRGKNNNKVDSLIISGLTVQVVPGGNTPKPADYVTVKGHFDCGYDPDGQYGNNLHWIMRGMVRDQWYYLNNCTQTPSPYPGPLPVCPVSMTSQTSTAVSMFFRVQPRNPGFPDNYPFDFESEIIAGSVSNVNPVNNGLYPAVQYVDCAGYFTGVAPAGNPTGIVTGQIQLDPGTTPANGDLFSGTLTIAPDANGKSEFTNLVMAEPGKYHIMATSGSLTATSGMFDVRPRTIEWADDPNIDGSFVTPPPVVDVYGLIGGTGSPVVVRVKNVHGNAVDGLNIIVSLANLGAGNSTSLLNGTLTQATSGGLASFSGLNINPYRDNTNIGGFSGDFVATLFRTGTTVDARYITNPLTAPLSVGLFPVELVSFNASLRNQVVTLKWRTATESNNHGFDIERSVSRSEWEKIGFVDGAGTSNTPNDYSFKDDLGPRELTSGTISYRLVQQDRDGKATTSNVVTVSISAPTADVELMQNYPNPFNPSTNISFSLPAAGSVTLAVYNELGVEVARLHDNTQMEAGWHTISFNAESLPSGLYTYRLNTEAGSSMKRMIVVK